MTRKDYEILAAALRRTHPGEPAHGSSGVERRLTQFGITTRSIADALQADNPRFDRKRFYAAAGYVVDFGPAFEEYNAYAAKHW